ncbi:hypothetical protein TG4357_02651 [Thalassovita gelatinovora]|uniref:Uncharacterized protein n=1 Tax=Thalassovita gelatinovora TaxID=53501 RepID=A0A0P1FFB6_THAGE|nr:hypothetical protein [Thalassovita gelatinovora]QIZ79776.1 hypothetical protein HFZ77_04420 [Thalassovita gelatinovora]CUH66807.1 hypothetical protein TG4357_02651 [Thalassovita gelatinovora]SEQ43121.1 hypothetical protein SAMN04488043_105188 [Thalassovita gelatinovora]
MPNVYSWPPVGLIGHAHTISRPVQMVRDLKGTPVFSQSEPTRRQVSAMVSGVAFRGESGGYIEALKAILDGKEPFVRMKPKPRHWWRLGHRLGVRGQQQVNFVAGPVDALLKDGAITVNLVAGDEIIGTAGINGFDYLDCTGFAPNTLVALPSEAVSVDGHTARCIGRYQSDATGAARIYLDAALPSGSVVIGREESIAFYIEEFPSASQPLSGGYSYDFQLTEIFEDEYPDGFTEVDVPWT